MRRTECNGGSSRSLVTRSEAERLCVQADPATLHREVRGSRARPPQPASRPSRHSGSALLLLLAALIPPRCCPGRGFAPEQAIICDELPATRLSWSSVGGW
jgi:hypothetical protein